MYSKQKLETLLDNETKKKMKLIKNPKQDFEKAINCFLKGEVGKFGRYYSVPNALVYRVLITKNDRADQWVGQDIIARRIGDNLIGNSSILPLIGRTTSFGRVNDNREVAPVQLVLGNLIPMIPFSVFDEANLNLEKLSIIERGPEETVTRKIDNPNYDSYDHDQAIKKGKTYKHKEYLEETVHFTGASLFKVENKFFLFDIDREEIEHKIFNPFLVEIPKQVNSISEAYLALKPDEVLAAEKNGREVIRQGEFFFVSLSESELPNLEQVKVFGLDEINQEYNRDLNRALYYQEHFNIQVGNNRPNYCQKGFEYKGSAYVTGLVVHSGREHRPITLVGWYKVIPNTGVSSFTIEGDID